MGRAEIEANYDEAKRQAKKLREIASDINSNVVNKLDSEMQSISGSWKGDNANAYTRKGNKLSGNIKKTSTNLKSVADTIEEIARNIYEADMRAWEKAQEKKHKKHKHDDDD